MDPEIMTEEEWEFQLEEDAAWQWLREHPEELEELCAICGS